MVVQDYGVFKERRRSPAPPPVNISPNKMLSKPFLTIGWAWSWREAGGTLFSISTDGGTIKFW